MKNLSYWQWIGIAILVMAVGAVIVKIIGATRKETDPNQTGSSPAPVPTTNEWAKYSYYPG